MRKCVCFTLLCTLGLAPLVYGQDFEYVERLWQDIRWSSAYGVAVQGDYAYVAAGQAGLVVLNVVNPAAPVVVGGCLLSQIARAVTVVGNWAYVADGMGGLRIVNIGDPAAPFEVGSLDGLGNALNVDVNGVYAYVAASGMGLMLINVGN